MSFNTLSKTSLGLNDQPAPELPDNIQRLQKNTGPERTGPDYPKHVNYPDGTFRVVNNKDEEDAAIAAMPPAPGPAVVSEDPAVKIARLEGELMAHRSFRPTPGEPTAVVPLVVEEPVEPPPLYQGFRDERKGKGQDG